MRVPGSLRAALLTLPFATIAVPAFAGAFSGDYTVTYLSGPSHVVTASQCLVFTHTGSILGFPNSGTWYSTTFGGWGGNYIADHGSLRFYGTYNNGGSVTDHYAQLSKVVGGPITGKGFDDWTVSAPPITAFNDGTITLTAGCAAVLAEPQSQSDSPTH